MTPSFRNRSAPSARSSDTRSEIVPSASPCASLSSVGPGEDDRGVEEAIEKDSESELFLDERLHPFGTCHAKPDGTLVSILFDRKGEKGTALALEGAHSATFIRFSEEKRKA